MAGRPNEMVMTDRVGATRQGQNGVGVGATLQGQNGYPSGKENSPDEAPEGNCGSPVRACKIRQTRSRWAMAGRPYDVAMGREKAI